MCLRFGYSRQRIRTVAYLHIQRLNVVLPFQDYPTVLVNLVGNLPPNGLVRFRLLLERRLDLLGSRKIASELLSLVPAVFSKLTDMGLEFEDLFGKTFPLLIGNWGFQFPGFNFRMILPDPAFGIVPTGLGIL